MRARVYVRINTVAMSGDQTDVKIFGYDGAEFEVYDGMLSIVRKDPDGSFTTIAAFREWVCVEYIGDER